MFSCEFFKISKNTFFTEHLWTTDSEEQSVAIKQNRKKKYISFSGFCITYGMISK